MRIFSERVIELWNLWEVRVTVLFSLSLQLLLIMLGSRRKYSRGRGISIILWLSYLSADWIATLSLGTLANSQGNATDNADPNNLLKAFWAPILLLHLGGPDTITAYALEDNELWLRHLLMLLVQLSVAFYIFLKSWTNTALTFIAIPMFIAGITKYGERTWVLRSSSVKQFEDSLLSAPTEVALQSEDDTIADDVVYLHEGYFLFGMFKYLFANLSLSFDDAQHSYSIITRGNRTARNAFKLVEVELGFLYDVLYTKAPIVYSVPGIFLRAISFLSSISALLAFLIVVDKQIYSTMDLIITYALLIGAVVLEFVTVVMIMFSDWTLLWRTKHKNPFANCAYTVLSCFLPFLASKKRCSGYISQQSLISFCLKEKASRSLRTEMFFSTIFSLKTYWHQTWEEFNDEMRELILKGLKQKHKEYKEGRFDDKTLNKLLSDRGNNVLKEKGCLDKYGWSVVEVEFNHSLLLWHIATDICFYHNPDKNFTANSRMSKYLSDYMLYILLMRPFMLPKWIGRIGYLRHTYKEAMRVFNARELKSEAEACKMLLQACTQIHPLQTMKREKKSRSVLFDGARLAKQLLESENRWEIIIGVWLEMLTYAASECGWRDHAQQLRRGGELLTQVCLLMANMGLSTQFQIRRWHLGSETNEVGWGWGRSKVRYNSV